MSSRSDLDHKGVLRRAGGLNWVSMDGPTTGSTRENSGSGGSGGRGLTTGRIFTRPEKGRENGTQRDDGKCNQGQSLTLRGNREDSEKGL